MDKWIGGKRAQKMGWWGGGGEGRRVPAPYPVKRGRHHLMVHRMNLKGRFGMEASFEKLLIHISPLPLFCMLGEHKKKTKDVIRQILFVPKGRHVRSRSSENSPNL